MKLIIDIDDGLWGIGGKSKYTTNDVIEDVKILLESASFIVNSIEEDITNANLRPANNEVRPETTPSNIVGR